MTEDFQAMMRAAPVKMCTDHNKKYVKSMYLSHRKYHAGYEYFNITTHNVRGAGLQATKITAV